MAIVIPNRRTLMDHLADVGSRYVQNKAETDRQRMAQEFQTNLAEGRNDLLRDQITLTGEQNRLLQEGRYAGEKGLQEGDYSGRVKLQAGEYKGRGELNAQSIAGVLAQEGIRSADTRYEADIRKSIAEGGFKNNIALGNINRYAGQDAIAGNYALEELKSATNIDLMAMSNQVRIALQRDQNNANLLQLMNSLDAELQWRRENGASQERIAGIGADVALDTNATNQQINADNNFSAELQTGIATEGAISQTQITQDAETKREP